MMGGLCAILTLNKQKDGIRMSKKKMIEKLRRERHRAHLLGVAAGTGMTANYAEKGDADFLLVLNSGRFRQMGRSSLGAFLPFTNSNEWVLSFAQTEILPIVKKIPVIFGVNAGEPNRNFSEFFQKLKQAGFSGINNYPTIGLFDGQFKEALEEMGESYQKEVELIGLANQMDLLTVAFVFNLEQAIAMDRVGADIICIHLGLTSGGMLGAKKVLSLELAIKRIHDIYVSLQQRNSKALIMIYGGPVVEVTDLHYIYNHLPQIDGFIGGSTFERLPSESTIIQQTQAFKNKISVQILDESKELPPINHYEYVDFVKNYIEEYYHEEIQLSQLAKMAHLSSSYLSTLFKENVGCSFTDYLIRFRMNKVIEFMKTDRKISLKEIASRVSYDDYAQFNKIFRKHMGVSPKQYYRQMIESNH